MASYAENVSIGWNTFIVIIVIIVTQQYADRREPNYNTIRAVTASSH